MLTASAETRKALAPPGERYTAFTGELIAVLAGGVPGGPELLDMETVYRQVRQALEAKVRPVLQQRNRNTDGLIALVRNAAFQRWLPEPATDDLGQLIGTTGRSMPSMAGPRVVPRQLPPVPRFFTGRVSELAALEAVLAGGSDHDGPAVVVLTGPGGVGKTAVALRWLRGKGDRFVDGQLYADLSAFGVAGAVAPEAVLGRFLRGMGVAGSAIPADLVELTALFRSVTAGKAMALLLDDAASSEQVQALLPASMHSVVVVTSRWRLSGLALAVLGSLTRAQ